MEKQTGSAVEALTGKVLAYARLVLQVHHVYLMTYQQYKAELLWIQVSAQEIFSTLNSIHRDAICHWGAKQDWRLITEVVYDPARSNWNELAKYPTSIGHPFVCRTVRINEVEQLFALWQQLRKYRCRLAYWFWTSRLGDPPVFSKEK